MGVTGLLVSFAGVQIVRQIVRRSKCVDGCDEDSQNNSEEVQDDQFDTFEYRVSDSRHSIPDEEVQDDQLDPGFFFR